MELLFHPSVPVSELFFTPRVWLVACSDLTGHTKRYLYTNEHVALERAHNLTLGDATARVCVWHEGAVVYRSC